MYLSCLHILKIAISICMYLSVSLCICFLSKGSSLQPIFSEKNVNLDPQCLLPDAILEVNAVRPQIYITQSE